MVRDAGELNLLGLTRRIGELLDSARSGTLTPNRYTGGTFTLTNSGQWAATTPSSR